ncbi:hypothetical protein RYX56_14620 [Alkalihalophilus lindianensis]|uniref:Lipoprotein n=1 Tax=Alkalihalophilus lindianensis TaxID=1630542 RepID=A0ABU3XCI2_9BACI|nr:hypothetical protein [Alkalihalophilus lindianensis]MDV2685597.1 hypothetical protein [Alkalihalophilus lindianensis]
MNSKKGEHWIMRMKKWGIELKRKLLALFLASGAILAGCLNQGIR